MLDLIRRWLRKSVPSSHAQSRRTRLHLESLEERTLPAVTFTIDPGQNVKPISRFIYGVNERLDGNYSNLTFTRLGGNRWSAYNWENNASNAGSDWYFQNDSYLGGGETPGGAVSPTIQNASSRNAGILLTVPINGYVAADKGNDGDVRNSGPNYLQTRFRQDVARKGSAFSLTPNLSDGVVYQDEFVNWVNTNYGYGQTDPNRPIWYSLDNEPDLWSETHAAIHPSKVTYTELVQKTIAYASAIKDVAPGSKVFGPANYGYNGYTTLQDAPDASGRDFQEYYLQQMAQAEQTHGKRLVDVLDVHWYPEAQGGGVRIIEQNNSSAVVAARLQAPRSLWDSTYTETSWITQWATGGPINLLPRLQDKITRNYPGTKLAITEYNYGGGNHISGAIAQADVLGIFGRDGVYAANMFPHAADESYIAAGFKMFRNFDGTNGTFGDTSIRATTDNAAESSIYASRDSANPNVITLVAINKTGAPLSSLMHLVGVTAGSTANIYQLTGSSATPSAAGSVTIADPNNFSYTMPAYSVSTIRITTSGSATPTLSINNVSVNEGDSGTSTANFTVTLSGAASSPVTVAYATANGPATAGSDYTGTSGALTFAPGETSKTVSVVVQGDTNVESDETFFVRLSNASGASITAGEGVGTIRNDDATTLSINNVAVTEGNSGTIAARFTVTLSRAASSTVSVAFATVNGTALAGSDYNAVSGTLTFAPGETSKTVSVGVRGDTATEANETFLVRLSNANGATIAGADGTGTIRNDDRPTITIGNTTVTEGNSGTTTAAFTVRLSVPTTQTVTVRYTTANGSAVSGSDYRAVSGTLTFAPGETQKTVNVLVNGDTVRESNETFRVVLSSAVNAVIGTSQGTGTILNDDTIASVSWVKREDWGTGFVMDITIRNTGTSTINGWVLEFDLDADITEIWSGAIVSRVGNHYTIQNVWYNTTIAPGAETLFGFVASNLVTNPVPRNFKLNGVPL